MTSAVGNIEDYSIVSYTDDEPEVPVLIQFPVAKTTKEEIVAELIAMINDEEYCIHSGSPMYFMWYSTLLSKNWFRDGNGINKAKIDSLIAVEPLISWVQNGLHPARG